MAKKSENLPHLVIVFPIFSLRLKFGVKRLSIFLGLLLKRQKRFSPNMSIFWPIKLLIKTWNAKENFADNHFNIIFSICDVLPNFNFIASETMCNYSLQTWYIRVASWVAEDLRLRILGN